MTHQITEAQTLTVAEAATPGRLRLQLIDSGWGSSGHYSPQVLENAAADKIYAAGTHVFFDHPGEAERYDRPERSVRDLVAVLDEDAHYDPDTRALVAEAKVIGPYRELVTDPVFMEAVGMSIRATADTTVGEADGRKGTLVTRLIEGVSVDLVTRAGRGGRILAAVESARATVREATANDTREALHAAVKAAHGTEDGWVWVRDFDPDTSVVFFDVEDADEMHTYRQAYELTDGTASLTGDPTEVRATTTYVPTGADDGAPTDAPAPAGQSTATESQEMNMANIQIEESQLASLRQDAERVPTLESERNTAVERAERAERERDTIKAREAARPAIAKKVGESGLPARRQARLTESLVRDIHVDQDGNVDIDAVVSATEAAIADEQADIAELAESLGVGAVRGFGAQIDESTSISAEDFDAAFARKEG